MRKPLPGHKLAASVAFVAARGIGTALAVLGFVLVWIGGAGAANQSVQGATKKEAAGGFESGAPYAILIEADSGSVLYEKNADQLTQPSGMLKLMTAEVVFNELKKGALKLTDEYRVSEYAWRKGGAPSGGPTMFAALKSQIKVEDLLRGMAIHNANDACIILAEGIAGDERGFIEKMTRRARELGLTQAQFANVSGVTDPDNKMTVREIARIAQHIIKTYPEFYPLYAEREFTWNKIKQTNRNPLTTSMQGVEGFTTGQTKEGIYSMVASVMQGGQRLIAVVNGVDDPDDRLTETKKLLDWGYRNFEVRPLFGADQVIGQAKVFGGVSSSIGLKSPTPVRLMVQRNGNDKILARIVYTGPVRAPIAAGQRIGVVKVWRGDTVALEAPLYAESAVASGSMTQKAFDTAGEMVIGLLRAGAEKALSKEPKAPKAP
jgi:serine-type D-Ala-D-Ala carboxypeptidase (penicillin-binding protein 5/6)